ncbi:MAG TPA: ABC transporter permease [Woeseiaceae bacterium]|nr:ABC transporter permease [Woeseiaceae bacterium]
MNTLLEDLRYAFRSLGKSPGFAAVAVLTLALGIGANSAIFSVVHNVLLQPLAYADPDRLVRVFHDAPEDGFAVTRGAFSPPDFEDLQRGNSAFAGLAAYYFIPGQSETSLLGGEAPQELDTAFVSAGFFPLLGVAPELGRTPGAEENVAGADNVVVLSHGLWQGRFGADPRIVGKTVSLDGDAFTIIGVMPAEFDFPSREAAMWVPLSLIGEDDIPRRRDLRWLDVVGRLAPGMTPESADAAADTVVQRLAREYPDSNEGWNGVTVQSLKASLVGDVRPALLVLLGAVALVLLIACANLANLLLARGSARAREFAIRTALGADRGRIVRQLLTESLVLALLGGALGLGLAYAGLDTLVALSADTIPRPDQVDLDLRVVAFALAASILTGVLFGLAPSLAASKPDLQDSLGEGGRSSSAGRRSRDMRGALVIAQTALAVVLLVGAGLLIRSFWNLTHVDPGFTGENVLSVSISTPSEVIFDDDRRSAYRREILSRVENLPGVIAVGGSKTVPLHGGGEGYAFTVPGRAEPVAPESGVLIVTPGYFRALGIPLLQGRDFSHADETAGAPVLVVNEAFARTYLPGRNPLGETLRLGETELRIVGLVGDVRNDGIAREAAPAVYAPAFLLPRSSMKLFIRTAADPLQVASAVRETIWDINPNQPVSNITTMQQVVSETVTRPRFFTLLLGGFAGLAMVLAALGVYGVIAYAVSRRTYEIGIRMALGARAGSVLRMTIAQGVAPALAGLVLGLAAAFLLSRVLSTLLYGVGAADPATFGGVALLLVSVALLAGWLPASRAARVNPASALRQE